MIFTVGDRVITNSKIDWIKKGQVGTVVHIEGPDNIGVSFDEETKQGHNCQSTCPRGSGWYVRSTILNLTTPKTSEELEKERYDRVLKKIKYLDSKFAQHQLKRKTNEKIQDISIQTALAISQNLGLWFASPSDSTGRNIPPYF